MKKIFRMIIFSGIAIFVTALWNKGFVIKTDPLIYLKASLIIALVYYLITPISKIILLPLNIFTFGFVSVVFYAVIFYFLLNHFGLVVIKDWVFLGNNISSLVNIFISSFSISAIINLLEKVI